MRSSSFPRLCWVVLALFASLLSGPAFAQQKLKWAHVYESSEPYHTESVWAAEEIKKRSKGKFNIQVFPASSLGKETDLNQGLTLGSVDIVIGGPSFAARSYRALVSLTTLSFFATATTCWRIPKAACFKKW